MATEAFATEIRAKQDYKYFYFQNFGGVYADNIHTFTTEILEDTLPEEALRNRKRKRKPNIDQKQQLKELLLTKFSEEQIIEKEEPFRVLQIKAKPSEISEFIKKQKEKILAEKISKILDEQQKIKLKPLWEKYNRKIESVKQLRKKTRKQEKKLEQIISAYQNTRNLSYETRTELLAKEIKETLDEEQKIILRAQWWNTPDKIGLINKLRDQKETELSKIDWIIKKYAEDAHKASFSHANKIVTGHYTELVRWDHGHPWSYHQITDDRIPEILQKRNEIEEKLKHLRAEAEQKVDGNIKRTISDMNKFFDENFCTSEFNKINKRAFAKKLGSDLIARRVEIQKQLLKLKDEVKEIGRIEHNPLDCSDEIKVVLNSADSIKFQRYFNSEELMQQDFCFIDIEKPRFNTSKEEVSWVAITYVKNNEFKKEIHTSKKVGSDFKQEFFSDNNCRIIDDYIDENELVAGVQESINKRNPRVLCTYNTAYDLIQLRETDQGLEIGKRKSRPKKEVTLNFFERIDVKDKIVIDPLAWAKIAKRHLPNRKLIMIAKELGIQFDKSIDYKMMAELEDIIDGKKVEEVSLKTQEKIIEQAGPADKIRNLPETCAQIIAKYVFSDVDVLPKLLMHPEFQRHLKHLDKICEFSDIHLQRAMHTTSSANNLQKKQFFEKTGTHLDVIHKITKASKKEEQRIRNYIKKIKRDNIAKEPVLGEKKKLAHFIIPSWTFFRKDIEFAFPESKQFFKYIDQQRDNPEDYYFLSQYADTYCKHLLQAWAKFTKARNKLEKRIKKSRKNFYKLDDSCRMFKDLLRDTHDKDMLKRAYVNKKTIEEILDPEIFLTAYYVKDEPDKYFEERKRETKLEQIKQINEILLQQEMSITDFQFWLNEWVQVAKKRNNVFAPYNSNPESIEIIEFEQRLINLQNAIEKAGMKIEHQKDEHLFTTVSGIQNLPEDLPMVLVDKIEKAYLTKDPGSGNRLYYPKNDFYGGIKIDEEPTNQLTLFEMKAYGGFLEKLFTQGEEAAAAHLIFCRNRFRENQVPNEELVFFVKKSQTYQAYVHGEKIKFYISDDRETRYDEQIGLNYVLEDAKDGEKEKIYVVPLDELILDRDKYEERIEKRIKKLLKPIDLEAESKETEQATFDFF